MSSNSAYNSEPNVRLSTELKSYQAAKLEVTPHKVQDNSLAGWQSVSGANLSVEGTNFVPSSAQLFFFLSVQIKPSLERNAGVGARDLVVALGAQ